LSSNNRSGYPDSKYDQKARRNNFHLKSTKFATTEKEEKGRRNWETG
jgi:hypothetical protein